MKAITLSVASALGVFLIGLPFAVGGAGASSSGEVVGWSLILAMFAAVPALLHYAIVFSLLNLLRAPSWLIVPIAVGVPSAIWLAIGGSSGSYNPLLISGVLGGLAGGIVMWWVKKPQPEQ